MPVKWLRAKLTGVIEKGRAKLTWVIEKTRHLTTSSNSIASAFTENIDRIPFLQFLYLVIPLLLLAWFWFNTKSGEVTGQKIFSSTGLAEEVTIMTSLVTAAGLTLTGVHLLKRDSSEDSDDFTSPPFLDRHGPPRWRFVYGLFPVYLFALLLLPATDRYGRGGAFIFNHVFLRDLLGLRSVSVEGSVVILLFLFPSVTIARIFATQIRWKPGVPSVAWDALALVILGFVLFGQFTFLYWYSTPIKPGQVVNIKWTTILLTALLYMVFTGLIVSYESIADDVGEAKARIGLLFGIVLIGFTTSIPTIPLELELRGLPLGGGRVGTGPQAGLILAVIVLLLLLLIEFIHQRSGSMVSANV